MIRIVLAPASPRRRALLTALGLHFDVIASGVDEHFNGCPHEMVVSNARAKRDDVAARLDAPSLVIAADTLVFAGEHVLGKPATLDEARIMVRTLSGNVHQVYTGLSLLDTSANAHAEGWECTDVRFRDLSDHEIDRFVEAVKPTDRAGAYTVDGPGSLLVASYCGCYYNVLGLPVVRLDVLARELGYSLFDLMCADRALFL
ncbi:MAG TPA: Maf family protein [Candidatus Hydrogenedentes bacterium]|nr:Maf family protein [Candidatus Hydrogenedentota bacterium]